VYIYSARNHSHPTGEGLGEELGTAVKRRSLAGELSLFCARPVDDK